MDSSLKHRSSTHPHDLGVTASTSRSEELSVAVLTVHIVLFLHKTHISQRHVAVVAVKLLGVPRPSEGHQEGSPGKEKNVETDAELLLVMNNLFS